MDYVECEDQSTTVELNRKSRYKLSLVDKDTDFSVS